MGNATTVAVPQSIDGRVRWGRFQIDKNVVYRQMFLRREDKSTSDEYTIMITRFPFGDFGYMVSIDGYVRYAQQFADLEDVQYIGNYMDEDYKQETIDFITFVLKYIINDYAKKDRKTGKLKLVK